MVKTYNDHRMAMAFSLIGLRVQSHDREPWLCFQDLSQLFRRIGDVAMIRLGLIGYPLGHSLSPKLHTAALQACNLQGVYSLSPVEPGDIQSLGILLDQVAAVN